MGSVKHTVRLQAMIPTEYKHAFPKAQKNDYDVVLNKMDHNHCHKPIGLFGVTTEGELLEIPYRIYHDNSKWLSSLTLSKEQRSIRNCLFTRHHDGYTREKYVSKILSLNESWASPYVVQLIGEYVVEILQLIYDRREELDGSLYREFIASNPEYFYKTKQRVISYWNCYYRFSFPDKNEYVGFKLIRYLEKI